MFRITQRMSKARSAGALIFCLVSAWWLMSLAFGWTFCFIAHDEPGPKNSIDSIKKGDVFAPLAGLDLDHGRWKAYIILGVEDFRELKGRFPRNCLQLSDLETLKEMQANWKMTYQGGDVATAASRLVLFRDGKLFFSCGLVLTKEGIEGLQSPNFGWVAPEAPGTIWSYCTKFKPVYWPIVVL